MNNNLNMALGRTAVAFLMLLSFVALAGSGAARAQSSTCTATPTVMPLTTGGWAPEAVSGSVSVSNDGANLYVTASLASGVAFANTGAENVFVWAGSDLASVPRDSVSYPLHTSFPTKATASVADTSYTVTIPFLDLSIQDVKNLCGGSLYVFLYADVKVNGASKLAWGGNVQTIINQYHWYYHGSHTVCCDTPPPVEQCETAFGKGGWVWTTDPKSNPEKLPTLGLTKNRWGWAINLTTPGSYTVPLHAGAGQNKASNKTLIGTVGLVWDGSTVTVNFNVTKGDMKEVHVYAGSTSPATTAPGQFGSTAYLASGTTVYSVSLPAVSTGGGIWVVAHAVACNR